MSVSISDYTMQYLRGEHESLRGINLKIKKGERVGILGPTGSGKTSLFMSLNGTIPHFLKSHTKGKIMVDGLDILEHTTVELAQHVSIVFADPSLSTVALAVEDDVAFGPQCLGWETPEIQKTVKEALQSVRLTGFERRSTSTLSGGELQALSIASMISMRTPILALDEPLCMVDPIGKKMIIDVIRDIAAREERTVLISEAGGDVEYFSELVNRIVVMQDGEIIEDASREEVLTNEKLMEKIGVQPPQVTRLAGMLDGPEPYPLGLEDGISYFKKLFKDRRLKQVKVEEKRPEKKLGKPIISVRNLHHVFTGLHDVHALNAINFDIYPGEIVGLIGQNGSGKTTLSLHLVGIHHPTDEKGKDVIPEDAEIIVDGANITELKRRRLFQFYDLLEHVNYAFQNPDNQLFEDTIGIEVSYGPKQLRLPDEEIQKRTDYALSLYGIQNHKDDPIIFLTKDMKTYTAAASIVAIGPKVLIIDEPTTGLDFNSSQKVMKALHELRSKGHTIIMITHDMRLIAEYADRCIVMGGGKIYLDGSPSKVFSKPEILAKVFVQPPQITRLGQALTDFGFPPGITTVNEMYELVNKSMKK